MMHKLKWLSVKVTMPGSFCAVVSTPLSSSYWSISRLTTNGRTGRIDVWAWDPAFINRKRKVDTVASDFTH